ncbi:MAG: DNA translocase FtsK 4TM domain-containing protein [Alphaproteobacteria bacterium]
MAYKFSQTKKISFFSEEVKFFFIKRLIELSGLFLIVLGFVSFASLASYRAGDLSFNTFSQEPIHNLMGSFGSHFADLLFQTFGPIAYIIPFIFFAWGAHVALLRHVNHMKWRLFVLIAALCALCVGSTLFSHSSAFGLLLAYRLDVVGNISDFIPITLFKLLLGVAGGAAYLWSLDIPKEMRDFVAQGFLKIGTYVWGLIRNLIFKDPFPESTPAPVMAESFATESVEMAEEVDFDEAPQALSPVKEKIKPVMELPKVARERNMNYKSPPLDLLQEDSNLKTPPIQKQALQEQADKLLSTLQDFGVQGEISNVYPGPVVTLYEFKPAPGMKSSRIISLSDDIARSMSSVSARIANIPGYNALGIELPNPTRQTVYMRSLLQDQTYDKTAAHLPLILGKNISGEPIVADLSKMPHLLVAGTTGSGKSVAINAMILSLIYKLSPEECKFIMIDPKMLELSVYDGIPHLLSPVVTDPHKAVMALKWTVHEMENRYQAMSKLGVRNIEGYNHRIMQAKEKGENLTRRLQTGFEPQTGKPIFEDQPIELKPYPFIVVIVDEMADLMLVAGKDIETAVQRLAQMARAAGIHLIMATQRPSVDVITGTIKANFPTRISFQVTSKIDSRTILGEQGAEQLLGQGDMLYMAAGGRISRIHGPFVRDQEVERIVQFVKSQGDPEYETSITTEESEGAGFYGAENSGDGLYDQAMNLVLQERKVSTSFIQRHLQIGYNRAARIVEKMEQEGVVSKPNHVGKREILVGN